MTRPAVKAKHAAADPVAPSQPILSAGSPGPACRAAIWPPSGFAIALGLLFFALNVTSVLHHAMWRDEWHVWEVARFSPSLGDLIREVVHSGRPAGWYVVAWVVCKLGFYPVGLKVFHALLSAACIYLFAQFAPFTRVQKALFAFGYFPFYEYGTIMRDYACELLLIVIACIIVTQARRRAVGFGIALALLFQTTAWGIVIGLTLAAVYAGWLWSVRDSEKDFPGWKPLLAGAGIALASLVLAGLAMRPPADVPIQNILGVRDDFSAIWLRNCVSFVWRAYCPLSLLGQWEANVLDLWPWLQFGLGAALLLMVGSILIDRPAALVVLVLGMTGISFLICTVRLTESLRYQGHYFILLVVSLWIYRYSRRLLQPEFFQRPAFVAWGAQQDAILLALLGIHLGACVSACSMEWIVPFSGSARVAEIIREKAPPGIPVIGDPDYSIAPVAGCLDRPIYIASRGEYATFLKIDAKRTPHPLPYDELAKRVQDFVAKEKTDVVLVVGYPLRVAGDNVQLLGEVSQTIRADERFYVFLIKYRPAP